MCSDELIDTLGSFAMNIVRSIKELLEKTPPELVGDIFEDGILLTGGGSLLAGLDQLITQETGIKCYVSEEPIDCVAIGTGKALELMEDGFSLSYSATKYQ